MNYIRKLSLAFESRNVSCFYLYAKFFHNIIFILYAGKGCKADIPTAYKYMSKGCDLNDEYGCVHAGMLGLSENKLNEDRPTQVHESIRQLKKACDMFNSEKACFYLSGIYLSGVDNIIDKNYKEAYKFSLKTCELGNPYACANLSQMHSRGEGAQKNPELAETFKKRALQLQHELKKHAPEVKFHQGIDP